VAKSISHAVISSAALPIEASCSVKVGLTKSPAPPVFLAPFWSAPFLPAVRGGILAALEWLEVVRLSLVRGIGFGLKLGLP